MDDTKAVGGRSTNEAFAGFDAEAALLALGPQLDWDDAENGNSMAAMHHIRVLYAATRDSETGLWLAWRDERAGEGKTTDGPLVATRQEAKAACERHHATGEWEV